MSRTRTAARRVTAAATAGLVTGTLLALAAPAHATSTIGGSITAAEMVSRAQYWVTNNVPYNQSGYAADPQGTTYREDCSGYVSMAWHLGTSLVVTDGGPSFTNSDGTPNSTYDTGVGAFTNLQTGDAMAYPHQHMWLFNAWTNKSTGAFTYYAESNPSDPTHGPSTANINNSSIEGWPTSGYVALRYKNLQAPAPAVTGTAGHASTNAANGTVVSFQIRSDGNLYETNQTSTTGGFTNWLPVSTAGGLTGDPASVLSPAAGGTVQVFARTTNGHIAVFGQSTSTSAFSTGAYIGSSSPVFGGDPTVTLAANGTMVVFGVDTNGDLWEINQTSVGGGWSAWTKLSVSGGLAGQPTATLSPYAGGTVQVFARTTDGHVGFFGQSGPTSTFSSGNYAGSGSPAVAGDPTVTLAANGTMVVFAVDAGGDLWGANQSAAGGAFGAWYKLSTAGGLAGTPSATLSPAGGGTVQVFARTADGHVAVFGQSTSTSAFSTGAYIGSASPAVAGDPSVNLAANGTMVVFASDGAQTTGTQYGVNQASVGSGFGSWWLTAS